MKSLPFSGFRYMKGYLFRAVPPRIAYYKEYPLPTAACETRGEPASYLVHLDDCSNSFCQRARQFNEMYYSSWSLNWLLNHPLSHDTCRLIACPFFSQGLRCVQTIWLISSSQVMHKEEISRIEYVVVFFRAFTVLVTWKVTWSKRYFWQIKWGHFSYVWNEFTEVRLRILN